MQIPRYWAKSSAEATAPNGDRVPVAVWRGSTVSVADAESQGRSAMGRIIDRIRQGQPFSDRYAYADRPVREQVQQQFPPDVPDPHTVITRNAYGSLVLNTDDVCFIDVDLPAERPPSIFARLLGRSKPVDIEAPALEKLLRFLDKHPQWGIRVYRTRSGLRYLVTHDVLTPGAPATESIMQELGADPHYIHLCRIQKCFRARLTPKPWRCGLAAPAVRFPFEDDAKREIMNKWEARYNATIENYATCRLMQVIEAPKMHDAVAPIVALHDEHTKATSSLPLA